MKTTKIEHHQWRTAIPLPAMHGRRGPNQARLSGDVRLPVAVDSLGRTVVAMRARGTGTYFCPDPMCRARVILRTGGRNRPHFAHMPDAGCGGEGAVHACAKRMVEDALRRSLDEGEPVHVRTACMKCGGARIVAITGFDAVELEARLPGGLVVDVGLLQGGKVLSAIEIVASHPMDSAKIDRMAMPWIELSARGIIEDSLPWVAARSTWPQCHDSVCIGCERRTVAERERRCWMCGGELMHGAVCGECEAPRAL